MRGVLHDCERRLRPTGALRLGPSRLALAVVAGLALSAPARAQTAASEAAPASPSTGPQALPLPPVDVNATVPLPPVRPPPPRRPAPQAQTRSARTPSVQSVRAAPAAAAAQPAVAAPPPEAASQLTVTGAEINGVPTLRVGEILEATPGLIVNQHSSEGKANQYFLRGFALDHGTDFAINVDGMPVNMRTHGHGQGYADINFVIPELIQAMQIRKGPYYADEGDFSSAGAARISYINKLDPGLALATLGGFGYQRLLAAKSYAAFSGDLLFAAEENTYNGPWDIPDKLRKLNGVLRYSQGTANDGFTLTGMGYVGRWHATDHIPLRAVESGLIDRFGQIDPTDGGETNRFSLSSRLAHTGDYGVTRVDAYAIRSSLTLFNDFTYFLNDPVNGDQFSQLDRRTSMGFDANHTFKGRLGQFDSETKIGLQSRSDSIDVGLLNTVQQMTLSTVRLDHVSESNVSPYAQNTTRWSDWLRTTVGIRGDLFWGKVASDTAANSGAASAFLASPKFGVVMGPFAKTEFYVNAGYGFHSNDLRGVTITVNPPNAPDAGLPANKVPLLVRSQGAEVGLRTKAIDGLESTLVAFVLDFASELQFEGDTGTTAAGRPSRRTGIEWTNHYQVRSWLAIDADLAISRARFTDFDLVGDYIPGSPMTIASVTATIGEATGWFGAARFRYLGPRPLIEDGSVWSGPMRVVNARVGYRFDNGFRVQFDALNLFNSNDHQIDYYYASRLPGEPAGGVNDIHFHPVEPTSVRLTVAGKF